MAGNERVPAAGPGPSDQLARQRTDTDHGTAPLLTVDRAEVLVLDAELAQVVADRREVAR